MEKKRRLSGKGLIKRILISAFCLFMVSIVIYVLFGVYSPGQNSVCALSSVCMDTICIIILCILTGSIAFGTYEMTTTTKLFLTLLLATLWALFLDFLNWAFDGSLSFDDITYWYTVGSLCMGAIIGCIFSLYLYSYLTDRHGMGRMHATGRACAIVNLISFFVTFTLAMTRTAFDFVDGHYVTGTLYDIVTAVPVVTLLYLIGYTIRYVKKIGIHDVLSFVGYILFMIFGALIEGEYSIGTTYVSVSIADIFIFIMLQNEIISLEKQNVEEWRKKSNTDELTGVFNRHAYEAALNSLGLTPLKENFVYVSIDVNGLKNVNDSLGHTAGDELIIGAARCLDKEFSPYGKLYRIGGDEFAALINVDENTLLKVQKNVEASLAKWSEEHPNKLSLSLGYVSAKEENLISINQLAILADKRMYEAKANYYRLNGNERRRTN